MKFSVNHNYVSSNWIQTLPEPFLGSANAIDHLRPKVWYENDRKNMENLLKHKLQKMMIFDQKILEVAVVTQMTLVPLYDWWAVK